jgi:hypothetical protein
MHIEELASAAQLVVPSDDATQLVVASLLLHDHPEGQGLPELQLRSMTLQFLVSRVRQEQLDSPGAIVLEVLAAPPLLTGAELGATTVGVAAEVLPGPAEPALLPLQVHTSAASQVKPSPQSAAA